MINIAWKSLDFIPQKYDFRKNIIWSEILKKNTSNKSQRIEKHGVESIILVK